MPFGLTPLNVSAGVSLDWMLGCDKKYIWALNTLIICRHGWPPGQEFYFHMILCPNFTLVHCCAVKMQQTCFVTSGEWSHLEGECRTMCPLDGTTSRRVKWKT